MFLPKKDPLSEYKLPSKSLIRIADIATQLPKLLLTGTVQSKINKLKPNDLSINNLIKSNNINEIKLAMVHISFISHAYIWGSRKPANTLPESLSRPWVNLSNYLANSSKIDLVTMPINKSLFKKKIEFTGMTEYLAKINKKIHL